jgi:hypothetical protein
LVPAWNGTKTAPQKPAIVEQQIKTKRIIMDFSNVLVQADIDHRKAFSFLFSAKVNPWTARNIIQYLRSEQFTTEVYNMWDKPHATEGTVIDDIIDHLKEKGYGDFKAHRHLIVSLFNDKKRVDGFYDIINKIPSKGLLTNQDVVEFMHCREQFKDKDEELHNFLQHVPVYASWTEHEKRPKEFQQCPDDTICSVEGSNIHMMPRGERKGNSTYYEHIKNHDFNKKAAIIYYGTYGPYIAAAQQAGINAQRVPGPCTESGYSKPPNNWKPTEHVDTVNQFKKMVEEDLLD